MQRKSWICVTAAAVLFLSGCGMRTAEDTVSVQSVASIVGYDLSGNNRFSGVTESNRTQTVSLDTNKTLKDVKVQQGDNVKKGDVLFTYDQEALEIAVQTAELELESIQNKINSYESQLIQLRKDKNAADKSEQLEYSLQIEETQLDQSTEQYNRKVKQKEIEKLKKDLQTTSVKAKVDGVVQSVNYGNTGEDGASGPFMTILETDVYQVKGVATEMDVASLSKGDPVTIRSRTDEDTVWKGKISKIDTGMTEDDSSDQSMMMGSEDSSDDTQTASKYPFYVDLKSSDGLIMGMHVYIELGEQTDDNGLWLNADYIVKNDASSYVWAADSKNLLEQRTVTLGKYNQEANTYEITDGLKADDYIAIPADTLQVGEKATVMSSHDEDASADPGSGEIIDSGSGEMVDSDDGAMVDTGGGEAEQSGDVGIMTRSAEEEKP